MLDKLTVLGKSRWYWGALALVGMLFVSVALFYQYILETPPCALCIQVRLLMVALALLGLAMLLLPGVRPLLISGHILTVVIALTLLERSYQLLGTEKGFVIGACGFDLGLPSWFAPDKWWPAMFEVQTTCGYTPELLFGITMAEVLIVFSVAFTLFSLLMTVLAFRGRR